MNPYDTLYFSIFSPTHHSFQDKEIPPQTGQLYKNPDSHSRKVHEQALTGMFGKSEYILYMFSLSTEDKAWLSL